MCDLPLAWTDRATTLKGIGATRAFVGPAEGEPEMINGKVAAGATAALILLAGMAAWPGQRHSVALGSYRLLRSSLMHQQVIQLGRIERRIPMLSPGVRLMALEAAQQSSSEPAVSPNAAAPTSLGCSNRTSSGDVRVNQDCTFQRQAEEEIAANPLNSQNLIAGQNDSSIGWNHCGFDYSLDGGLHWGSGIPPFYQRLNHPVKGHTIAGGKGTGHTYDAASDPSVAFDSRGNAYFACILFDVNGNSNGLLVARSPAGAEGSYYDPIPAAPSTGTDPADNVVVEDNSSAAVADKDFITADSYPTSPHRDNVYVTWTEFISNSRCTQGGGQCSSPIYFSRSRNHGLTWSKPIEISGLSKSLCFNGNVFDPHRKPHQCDLDEGPEPVVLPNGNIVVVYNNANTSSTNADDQQLAVVSKNGGKSWSAPALVGRDVTPKEPQCNFGQGAEECNPGAYIRVEDFPQIAVDGSNGHLFVVWNDYHDGRFDIRVSRSTNRGRSWKVAPASIDNGSTGDDYMPSIGVSPVSHDLAIGYYTTPRVLNENKHSAVFKPGMPGVQKRSSRYLFAVSPGGASSFTSTAISPSFVPPNGIQTGFNGDYTGVTITGNIAHPIWSDTRNSYKIGSKTFNDEDVFTKAVTLP